MKMKSGTDYISFGDYRGHVSGPARNKVAEWQREFPMRRITALGAVIAAGMTIGFTVTFEEPVEETPDDWRAKG